MGEEVVGVMRPAAPGGRVAGDVIALNGTSSAGKSTIAVELQARLIARGKCWIILGIDDFLGKLPAAWVRYVDVGAHADEGVSFERIGGDIVFRAGPVGRAVFAGYRRSVAAVVRSGVNVIVDEVVLDEEAWTQWHSELRALDPFWVRVDCPIEVCERRERARADRLLGLARSQAPVVHRYPPYQFSVDTSTAPAAELADAVIAAHSARQRDDA
jgi:chloramphenicol 3-O phosphotransferase